MPLLSSKLEWPLANPRWASVLNPILSLPFLSGNQIDDVILVANTPKVINHLLQRMPQGWMLTDNNSNAVVWRSAALNDLTITLEASANTTVSFWIF